MKTRKELHNECTQLRAQLDVHKHVTRAGLNAHVQRVEDECVKLEREKIALTSERDALLKDREALRDKLTALQAAAT